MKTLEEKLTEQYIINVSAAGFRDKLKDVEIAIETMIKSFNMISEIQLDYNDYKVFYENLELIHYKDLIKIYDERKKILDDICEMRNNLINPVIELSSEDIDFLLNNPEEDYNKSLVNKDKKIVDRIIVGELPF